MTVAELNVKVSSEVLGERDPAQAQAREEVARHERHLLPLVISAAKDNPLAPPPLLENPSRVIPRSRHRCHPDSITISCF